MSERCVDCLAPLGEMPKKQGPKPVRCWSCRQERLKEQRRASARRSKARKREARDRHLEYEYQCEACGKWQTVRRRGGKVPIFCEACRTDGRVARARERDDRIRDETRKLKKAGKTWPDCACGTMTMEEDGVCGDCKAEAMARDRSVARVTVRQCSVCRKVLPPVAKKRGRPATVCTSWACLMERSRRYSRAHYERKNREAVCV